MKKICFLFILLAIANLSFAQNKVVLKYKFTQHINGITGEGFVEQYYANGRSIEIPLIKNDFKSDTTFDGQNKTMSIMLKGSEKRLPFVLKTPESHSLVYADRIGLNRTVLAVDSLNNFKWNVSDETKIINEEVCIKASTYFRGRNYIAWFKKDTSIQTGPWKFGGLPGIIFEIKDENELFTYLLYSIELVDELPMKLKLPDSYINEVIVAHSEYITAWKDFKKDLERDNGKVTYTLTGSNHTNFYVAPIKELY